MGWVGVPQIMALDFDGMPVTLVNFHAYPYSYRSRGAFLNLHRKRHAQAQILADFAREFAIAYQRSSYILWLSEMRPQQLTSEVFEDYDRESKTHFPQIVAAQVMLATHNKLKFPDFITRPTA